LAGPYSPFLTYLSLVNEPDDRRHLQEEKAEEGERGEAIRPTIAIDLTGEDFR